MPIYEYRCETCQCDFEYIKFRDSDPEPACPTCCGTRITRLMSAASHRPQGIPKGKGGFQAPARNCRPSGG